MPPDLRGRAASPANARRRPPSTSEASRNGRGHPAATDGLRCRVRLADGRTFTGTLPPERHRALQLGLLHRDTAELVELTPGTRPPGGKLDIDRRRRAEHYLPGGASGQAGWLDALLEHAEQIIAGAYTSRRFAGRPREEVFVGVAPRTQRRGNKQAVAHTRFLWIDIDQPGQLPVLWAFLAERPCHLLVESGGSGGAHAYWKLDRPLAATRDAGEPVDAIEQANLRLIHRLGAGPDGKPTVADVACKERARVMRLAGTINHKTGRHARIMHADFELPAYAVDELVGDLPDPAPHTPAADGRRAGRRVDHDDPYKRISPPEYFERLAGIDVPRGGLIRCPVPGHEDRHPSCSVGTDARQGWRCHSASCGARGAIYDLASVLLGGPYGPDLRGDAFKRARAYVADIFGDLT